MVRVKAFIFSNPKTRLGKNVMPHSIPMAAPIRGSLSILNIKSVYQLSSELSIEQLELNS